MSTPLKITIYNSDGQQQFVNDLKISDGTIVTEEMQKGTNSYTTSVIQIISTNYGISGFDDTLSLSEKIKKCEDLISTYKLELETAESLFSIWNGEYITNRNTVTSLQQELKYLQENGGNQDEIENIQDQLEIKQEDLEKAYENKYKYQKQLDDNPNLIQNYENFLYDLKTYGETKTIQTPDAVGDNSEDEEIDLDNLDINNAPGMSISSTVVNAVSQYIEATVQSLIAGGTTSILGQLGINQENLQIAQNILGLLDSAIFKIESIIPFIPTNIYMSPSPKVAISAISTSLKDMYMAVYVGIENEYYETINDAITNLPSIQEVLADSQEALLQVAESLIDEQCIKYTGHTLVELYYMCSTFIGMYKAWREARKLKRQQKELEEESNIQADEGKSTTINVDTDSLKEKLMEGLQGASDLIYNSFLILQIKDAISSIRDLIKQFNNIDLTVLSDGINSLDDLITLLDEIGLNDDSAVLTLADAIKSGINDLQGNLNSLTAQLAAQMLSTVMQAADSVYNDIKEQGTNIIQNNKLYDFTNDLNNMIMTLNIYSDPTVKSTKKKITNSLSNATGNDKKKIFDAATVLQIITAIESGYSKKEDVTLKLLNFDFIIHFELEGFGENKVAVEDTVEYVNQYLKEVDAQQELESALSTFELGVVTEEYTKDPTEATKRPTFQLVHELYAVLSEIFPLLKTFATLVSNYKINKAKVENNAEGNIFGMVKVLAKINNLLKRQNKNNKNFYTIRTLKLYDYVTQNIKTPDTDTEINLDNLETKKLYQYLKVNNLNYDSINLSLNTLLYIDQDSINEQIEEYNDNLNTIGDYFGDDASLFAEYPDSRYNDGTTDGLDKVEVAGDIIYYSDSSLPLVGSQILRCYSKGYNVNL